MEVEAGEASRELTNNVMCPLSDPEGTPLGASMYLPQSVGPKELQQMVNKLLNNSSEAMDGLKSKESFFVCISRFSGFFNVHMPVITTDNTSILSSPA
ncbi:hypothetical protein HanPI659440_Chr16g0652251 [Helianthus annuus]|nr:hypothetical protein HanPI659440_Chr16g0652251 [Helianthus annuus]